MRIVDPSASWLSLTVEGLTETELYELFDEIAEHRDACAFRDGGQLLELSKAFADQSSETSADEALQKVEDAVIYEIARRANNKFAARMGVC